MSVILIGCVMCVTWCIWLIVPVLFPLKILQNKKNISSSVCETSQNFLRVRKTKKTLRLNYNKHKSNKTWNSPNLKIFNFLNVLKSKLKNYQKAFQVWKNNKSIILNCIEFVLSSNFFQMNCPENNSKWIALDGKVISLLK